ncbi:MAG TPA: SEL1-like repeat protein [Candidatus Izemoplasmatales bacterium]|nr:SEL1-like repeat protein [Candidatus Izemoplasmatales bacterium]
MNETMSPKQLNDLGDAYFYGIGRPVNREMAYTFYKQAADLDNPVGLYNVGLYFLTKNDFAKALDSLEKARACHYSPAMMLMGEMRQHGKGVRKNRKKAFRLYLEAAGQNDVEAFNAVAGCYAKGIGVGKNSEKARDYYQKSADLGNPIGEWNVGLFEMETKAYRKNPENALYWLDKAASHGSVEAMKRLISIYQKHDHPHFRKKSLGSLLELTFYYQELLAKTGDPEALKAVADAYSEGKAPAKKNHEKAAGYFKQLADLGNPDGKYGYAVSLLYGLGVPRDVPTAKKLLEECAQKSHPSSLTRLGDIFRLGLGVPVDPEEAKKWYMEAAKQNDPEALMNLGLLNYRQAVENATPALALGFMETAAKKGYHQAWYWLGIFHDKGVGCDPSFAEARKCFETAISKGSLGAKYKYAAMILDELPAESAQSKKNATLFQTAKRLLIEYVLDPQHNEANSAFAMHYLGKIHRDGLGIEPDLRVARYWFESGAEAKLAIAMVELYRLMRDSEFDSAFGWLKKAVADPACPEAYYEIGCLYLTGVPGKVKIDVNLAKSHLETAAKLKHGGALEKLMMM